MATYGIDYYGLVKYGTSPDSPYSVSPFLARPLGYGTITVTWAMPTGTWQELRLLRSAYGYAADENDGTVLVDTTTGATGYVDNELPTGAFYYYTIFVYDGSTWFRAGATSGLCVADQGYSNQLWTLMPAWFQSISSQNDAVSGYTATALVYDRTLATQPNQQLQSFMNVLAWGLDYLKTYSDTVLWANDVSKMHLQNLNLLAEEFGTEYNYAVTPRLMRSMVGNATQLGLRRGTEAGLAERLKYATGWDIDLSYGVNLFLDADESEFLSPQYNIYSQYVNYAVGQYVEYEGYIYECAVGAYNNPPNSDGTSNTYWTVQSDTEIAAADVKSAFGVYTWGSTDTAGLAVGISSPNDTNEANNSLYILNSTAAAEDIYAELPSVVSPTANLPEYCIPIPQPTTWDSTIAYQPGNYVIYFNRMFLCLAANTDKDPDDNTAYWQQVGIDERPKMAWSFYTHGPFTGTAGTGGVAVTPGMKFYDPKGNLLGTFDTVVEGSTFFDTFNDVYGGTASVVPITTGRAPDIAILNDWTVESGNWYIWNSAGDDRVAFCSGDGALVVSDARPTSYDVAVTFASGGNSGVQALVLHYSDANNYIRVTRTGVDKCSAGTITSLATFATEIVDGDRVIASLNDTAATLSVTVNGTTVASGISTTGYTTYADMGIGVFAA